MTESTSSKTNVDKKGVSMAFEFGDPEPVLSSNPMEYLGTYLDIGGDYYRPPVDFSALAKLMDANANHGSILHFKKNMVLKWFVPGAVVNYATLKQLAMDYAITGNMYLQLFFNAFTRVVRVGRLPVLSMRRGKKPGQFFKLNNDGSQIEFEPGEVVHITEPDIRQEVYGLPEYLGGIQSVLLSEDSGLFRRKYYINGAHMGYILVTNDADLDEKTAKLIEQKVKDSKGPGNFRSLFLNIAKSQSREPVKVIPVGDIATKDEFERVKHITRDEILAMHRMQPGLSGIMPDNTGGYGDIEKILRVYYELEVEPLQKVFLEINERIGVSGAVSFRDPDWKGEDAVS